MKLLLAALLAASLPACAQTLGCDFSNGRPDYDKAIGHGFVDATHFAADLPEGNYAVTLKLGDAATATDTTVKAEARRLMLESVKTKPGELVTRSFTVNIRTPKIAGGGAHSRANSASLFLISGQCSGGRWWNNVICAFTTFRSDG